MGKPPSTWKSAERAIAKFFGAKRRGADYRGEGHAGKTDLVLEGWAVEVKHTKSPTWGLLVSAVQQAETNKIKPDDIPVAVIHKAGSRYKDSLVIMRLEEFQQYFINVPNDTQ